jgi:hypothetical protein
MLYAPGPEMLTPLKTGKPGIPVMLAVNGNCRSAFIFN